MAAYCQLRAISCLKTEISPGLHDLIKTEYRTNSNPNHNHNHNLYSLVMCVMEVNA